MKGILVQNNLDLRREIVIVKEKVEKSTAPRELDIYRNWVLDILDSFLDRIEVNSQLISLDQKLLLSEILSETQNLTINLRALTERYLAPLIRHNAEDIFCLKAINWLHNQHPQSKDKPFAISDGGFAIFPTVDSPVIYFLPISSLNNLTHLPLIFHEFGHYLYAFHQEEMDSLVKSLQRIIWNKGRPSYVSNNAKSSSSIESLNKIVETWYEWMQEFFCDAVGLQIGGIAYLKTFSIYLRMMGRGQFRAQETELIQSSHPITWLRIKFLVLRARELGLADQADEIENEWDKIAFELQIKEEYYGFYHSSFAKDVYDTIDDMLTEANPINFKDFLNTFDSQNIVQLTNTAWTKYEALQSDYDNWENLAINRYIQEN